MEAKFKVGDRVKVVSNLTNPSSVMEAKFKVGDRVKVLSNKTNPSSVGKVGTIVKAVEGISHKTQQKEMSYKVQLDNHKHPLKYWAGDENLELC